MALFETKNLTFSYPLSDKTALKNVDLKVEQGEFILVMGKSGSGKSTLLRLLKKEIAPVGKIGGEININCDSIGFVGQNPETSFVCDNVRSELAFALENEKYSNDEITVRIGETASFFNLNFLLDKKIDELSGGEKASVAIASAIISDVQVLLLDEPLSQLDPKAVTTVSSMLKRINEELGVTVIVVSHSSEEFIDFCDRLVILENGEIICNDTPYNAKNNASLLPYFPICTRLFDFQVVLYYLFNEVQALLFACFFAFYFCHNAIVIRIVVQKYDYFFVYRYFTGIYPLFFSDFLSGRRQTRTVKAGVFCMRIKATHVAFLLHAADLCVL